MKCRMERRVCGQRHIRAWLSIFLLRYSESTECVCVCVCAQLLKGHRDWLVPSENLHLSLSACISAYIRVYFCACLHSPMCFHPLGNSVVMLRAKTTTTKGGERGRELVQP